MNPAVCDLAWYVDLAGTVLNFIGGMMMVSGYLSIDKAGILWWRSVRILCEVWWPGRGRTAAAAATINPPNNLLILRGVGLLVLGFALQFVSDFG